MTTRGQKIRIGAFVVATGILLTVVLAVWGGMRLWGHRKTYTIVFDGTVYGLEPGAQVYIEGIKVGRVENLAIVPENLGRVRATISVKADTPVRADTRAVLQYAGITGLKVIDLRGGTLTAVALPEGSQIETGQTVLDKLEAQAEKLADRSVEIMDRAKQITDNLVALTDPKRLATIDELLEMTKQLEANMVAASSSLNTVIAENRVALRGTLKALNGAMSSVHTLIDDQVGGLVGSAHELVENLSSLVRSSDEPLRSAVFDLRQASRNFKELSRDVRQRPSRLLFSNPPKDRKLP